MKTTELAEKVQAEEFLLSRGYTKHPCELCKGTGYWVYANDYFRHECNHCEGRGFNWKGPVEKLDNPKRQ